MSTSFAFSHGEGLFFFNIMTEYFPCSLGPLYLMGLTFRKELC